MASELPTCFVIMPFGEKKDVEGKTVDFNEIYDRIISGAIEDAGLAPTRTIDVEKAGFIHRRMIEHIRDSPVAVVDLSLLNANVFYELGIRHSLRQFVTVLIRRRGTSVPFNIKGLDIIEYDETEPEDKIERTKKKISTFIRNGLDSRDNDSLVHEVLDLEIRTPPKRLPRTVEFRYRFRDTEKTICLLTGDIKNIKGQKAVDIWVNSENTNMQMARYYDWGVSAIIRYFGAKRNARKKIVDDIINRELLEKMEGDDSVAPGTVISTSSGELKRTHGVQLILHVASVAGAIGHGYDAVDNLSECVRNVLEEVDTELSELGLKSILFPLLAAGVSKLPLSDIISVLFEAAVAYLHDNPDTILERICFIAWSDIELKICRSALKTFPDLIEQPVS